jgi:DNA-3-methyladenine glycosylase II
MEIFSYSPRELDYLKSKDKKLGLAIERIGTIKRRVIPDLFAALVNTVISQQISTKAAATVWRRIQERFEPLSPQSLCEAALEEIQQCGLSWRKAEYLKGIGEAVAQGRLAMTEFSALDDADITRRLSAMPGIGIWSAEMLLIFSLQRPDVVSWGDLGIRRGMMRLYGLEKLDKTTFDKYKKRYSPYGSVASLYLWAIAAEQPPPPKLSGAE